MIHKAKSDEETVREHRAKSPRHFSNGDRSRSPRLRQDRSKSPISTRSRSPKCHCRDRSKSPCAAEHRSKSPSGHRHKSKDQQHLRPKSPSPRSRIRATSPIKNEGGSHGKHKSEDGARSRNHEKTPKKLRHQRSRRNSMVDNEEQNETSSSQSEHDTCQRKGSEKKSVSTSHMKVAPTPGILRHDVEGSSGSTGVGHARAEDHKENNLTKTHRNQKSSKSRPAQWPLFECVLL
ncbi:hypothetical protein C0Q70_08411 [Pomacea canaliculata]|uniref:Uncharacterized protein n=1 Tax=Pomacea canaliculata TaxID=400727 RepID=A0A2T7PHR3_POMCA|nr:hypothetical protein C0Q70_08411 [Pomacea canaliculata]